MTIMLANKNLRIPNGVVEDATVTIGNKKFPIDFVVVDMPADTLFPFIFGRNFLSDVGATVDLKRRLYLLCLGTWKKNSTYPNLKTNLYLYKKKRKRKLLRRW